MNTLKDKEDTVEVVSEEKVKPVRKTRARKTKEVIEPEEESIDLQDQDIFKIVPKIYYFTVKDHINTEGEEILYSTASLSQKFDCEWSLPSIVERAASKFYAHNPDYKNLDKWPLTFKFYINPKVKAVHECLVALDYVPVFSEYIHIEEKEVTL